MPEIAGRDEKGKPLTAEEVAERTKKKLEEDEKAHEEVREKVKADAEKATKEAEAQAKADKEFLEKDDKKEQGGQAPAHPQQPKAAAAHR